MILTNITVYFFAHHLTGLCRTEVTRKEILRTVQLHESMYVCVCIYVCVNVCVCTYKCTYVCMYLCIFIEHAPLQQGNTTCWVVHISFFLWAG